VLFSSSTRAVRSHRGWAGRQCEPWL